MRTSVPIVGVLMLLAGLTGALPAEAAISVEPTIVSAVYDGDADEIVVTWTAGTSDVAGAAVTHSVAVGAAAAAGVASSPVQLASPGPGSHTVTITATETVADVVTETATASTSVVVPEPPPPAGPPSAPTVSATASGQNVTVSWAAAAENGAAVTGYDITLSTGQSVSRGAGVRTVLFSNVAPGTVTATVIAKAGDLRSEPGTAGVTVDPPPPLQPSAPRNPSATPNGTSVTISWTAPAVNPQAVTGYRVTLGDGKTTTVTALSATFSGLVPGPFEYSIESLNGNLVGGSAGGTFQIAGNPGTPPNVSPAVSGSSVTVTWGASSANGGTLQRYEVSLSPAAGSSTQRIAAGAARSATFSNLPDGSYTVSVRAVSNVGTSGPGSATFTIDAIRVPSAPGNVQADASGQSVTVTWSAATANGSPVTGYRVRVAGITRDVGPGARSVRIDGVSAGSFTAQVVARSAVGDSIPGSDGVVVSIPLTQPTGPPTNVEAQATQTSVTIGWAAPGVTANNAASAYVVTLTPLSPGAADGLSQTVGGTSATFDDLPPGEYGFGVVATNSAGSSAPATGSFSIRTVPSAPLAVTIDSVGRSVVVGWEAPASDGNSPIVDYIVTLSSGDVVIVLADEPLTALFADLELGEHSATIIGRNNVGGGPEATTDLVTTLRPFEPFETEDAFLAQQYRDFLGREPDGAGLSYWRGITANDRSNIDQVIEAFMTSEEFLPRRAIARLYLAFFDRAPDQGGFDFWADEITGSRATLDTISESFVGSTEFQDTYGSLSDAEFISLVYNNVLIRQPDATGFDYWRSQMDAGLSRGELMTEFSESPEFIAATRPAVDVIVTYRGMLNREPDSDGFQFWVVQIAANPDSLRQLVKGFFFTPEYASRVVPE